MSAVIAEITINQFWDGEMFTNLLCENQFLRTTLHYIITKNWFYSFGEQTSLHLFNQLRHALTLSLPAIFQKVTFRGPMTTEPVHLRAITGAQWRVYSAFDVLTLWPSRFHACAMARAQWRLYSSVVQIVLGKWNFTILFLHLLLHQTHLYLYSKDSSGHHL